MNHTLPHCLIHNHVEKKFIKQKKNHKWTIYTDGWTIIVICDMIKKKKTDSIM